VAWHAVDTSPITQRDSVLVPGGGSIGLEVIQCLKARGTARINIAEVARERQSFAKMFGLHSEDAVKKSKEICTGQVQRPHLIVLVCLPVSSSIALLKMAFYL
jgi:threonine dehydrogenase-like Zn-dependent dehydrogenase